MCLLCQKSAVSEHRKVPLSTFGRTDKIRLTAAERNCEAGFHCNGLSQVLEGRGQEFVGRSWNAMPFVETSFRAAGFVFKTRAVNANSWQKLPR